MKKKRRGGLWRKGREVMVLGAILPMTLAPQIVSAGILAPQGLPTADIAGAVGSTLPGFDRAIGLQAPGWQEDDLYLPDAGILPVSGPCPDEINDFSSAASWDDDPDLPGFNFAEGNPSLDDLIRHNAKMAADAKVQLASCHEGPTKPDDPIKVTADIGAKVNQINDTCSNIHIQHRVYCLANQYQALAQQLPQGGQYYEMRRILQDTADQLRDLADQNADPEVPAVRVPDQPRNAPGIARAPLPAVRADRVEATAAAATVILQNAQILLIRSVEESETRFAAYQTVASGMDNSMLLLRS